MKRPITLLLSLAAIALTSCGKPPEQTSSHKLPCTWTESAIKHEHFTEHVYKLGLSREKEWFDSAVLVIAVREGGKAADWTIRKVEPFRPRWDAPHIPGGMDLAEWYELLDPGKMVYHVTFLDEELKGDTDGQSLSIREGPVDILGDRFAGNLREKAPDKTAKFAKISGLTIDAKYQGRVTEIFCGLVR